MSARVSRSACSESLGLFSQSLEKNLDEAVGARDNAKTMSDSSEMEAVALTTGAGSKSRAAYQREWRKKNLDKVTVYQREWRKKNPEKVTVAKQKWYEKNRDKINARQREQGFARSRKWQKKNPDKVRAAQRERRKKNPDKFAADLREWCRKNPDKVRASNKKNHKKRFARDPEGVRAKSRAQYRSDVERSRAYHREWRKKNPERARGFGLKFRFGIGFEHYEALLRSQNGGCAICGGQNSKGRALAVDHCHKTGKVRGLLCSKCNSGIGMLGDSSLLLKIATEYVVKWES